MAGIEFAIVVNGVVVCLRPHEEVMPDVIANTPAKVAVEMSCTRVIRAAREAAVKRAIDTDIFGPDSGHQFGLCLLP